MYRVERKAEAKPYKAGRMIGRYHRGVNLNWGRRTFICGAAVSLATTLLASEVSGFQLAGRSRRLILYVEDFRRPGRSDKETLDSAFKAWARQGGELHLCANKVYDLGSKDDAANVFSISGVADAILCGNGAIIRIQTTGDCLYSILTFANYKNVRIENLHGTDDGYRDTARRGAKFIALEPGIRGSVDLALYNVSGNKLVSFIQIQGPASPRRVSGIHIDQSCRVSRSYYALCCQNQGDNVSGGFTTINCRRSYFPYGIAGHHLTIRVEHGGLNIAPGAETCALIKTYGRPTRDIKLDISFAGTLPWAAVERRGLVPGSCVTLEHQPIDRAGPTLIDNIDATITTGEGVSDPYGVHRFALRSRYADGTEESKMTSNIWRRIRIAGNLGRDRVAHIFSRALPAIPTTIAIEPSTIGASREQIYAPGFRFAR